MIVEEGMSPQEGPEDELTLPQIVARETAVRVVLFNARDEILLQGVNVPGKPEFFITPGGRLEGDGENLLEAAKREIEEETGFKEFEITTKAPVFTGSHVMHKSKGLVGMTEHFFVARLTSDEDQIDESKLQLTEEEQALFTGQKWFKLEELESPDLIFVPINLREFAQACLRGQHIPEVDFSDPPQFSS